MVIAQFCESSSTLVLSGTEKTSLLRILDAQNPPAHFPPLPVHGLPPGHVLNIHPDWIGLLFCMYLVGAWETTEV